MVQTIGKQNKMTAILFLNLWKTELQNLQYSNVFGIPLFGIQAPTVSGFKITTVFEYQTILQPNLFPPYE